MRGEKREIIPKEGTGTPASETLSVNANPPKQKKGGMPTGKKNQFTNRKGERRRPNRTSKFHRLSGKKRKTTKSH